MTHLGPHTHGLRTYQVWRADDGYLHLYRTTKHDKVDGFPTEQDRIVTPCTSMEQLAAYLKKKRRRRIKINVTQLSIDQ